MQLVRKSLVATAIFSVCSGAMAAGFQISEHSAKALGRANAGEAAVAADGSVVAANPALMTQFNRPIVSVTGAYIMPDIDMQGSVTNYFTTGAQTVPSNSYDVAPNEFVPEAFYVAPINDQWAWGIGGFSNFGLVSDYDGGSMSAPLADKTDLKTYNLNPSIAYKVNDSFSVGFGLDVVYAKATLNASMPTNLDSSVPGAAFAGQKITELKGDDYGFGWNFGLSYDFSTDTRVGFAYRSKVDLTIKGDINTGILPTLGAALYAQDSSSTSAAFLASLPSSFGDSVDLTLPAIWELAVNQKINEVLSVQASINRVEWSEFDKLEANSAVGAELLDETEDWNDTWYGAVGLTYIATNDITLRAGIKYDQSPVNADYRNLRIPDTDRTWYSVGMTYSFNKDFDVDFAYNYLDAKKANIDEGSVIEDGSPSLTGNFTGEMSGHAQILSVQGNYRF